MKFWIGTGFIVKLIRLLATKSISKFILLFLTNIIDDYQKTVKQCERIINTFCNITHLCLFFCSSVIIIDNFAYELQII